jgi:hypothetical protein
VLLRCRERVKGEGRAMTDGRRRRWQRGPASRQAGEQADEQAWRKVERFADEQLFCNRV